MKNFNFGENLRMMRSYKNVCQEGMARGLNISQASYSRIEASPAIPADQLISQLAETLGVETSFLLSTHWYSQAVNQRSLPKRHRASINRGGQIVYGLLLTVSTWDATSSLVSGANLQTTNAFLLIGCFLGLGAFFLFHFTVKHVELSLEEDHIFVKKAMERKAGKG